MPKEFHPEKISATLPALGTHTIPFYKESSKVLSFLGEKERKRLSKIAHLGTASEIFTGINHSRLEYMLLQCAIINLLPKFNLEKEQFATSGKVKLANSSYQISSGEELLKCWSILGSVGHAQYTYGVERALFSHLRRDKNARKLVLSIITTPALRKWSAGIIDSYRDSDFHWVLSAIRIHYLPKRSRDKSLFVHCLKNLLLPLEELNFKSHNEKYKVYRLRKLFEKIRLLSLVTLDSYYSHHPVRYQISAAIMDLENLFSNEETQFEKLLSQTAGWLADELYMHPESAAVLRYYETKSANKFRKHHKNKFSSTNLFREFMSNFMSSGFGQPKTDHLKPFLRFSLTDSQSEIFKTKDTYVVRNRLEKKIAQYRKTRISVLRNPFSKMLHIDLLYDYYESTP